MEVKEICSRIDHTNLNKTATEKDIVKLCQEAKTVGAASVCVAPCYVSLAFNQLMGTPVKVCTVIGFPNGYNTTEVKIMETKYAVNSGADEIDMVINVGLLKMKKYDDVYREIVRIANICHNAGKILKVIIECCLLDRYEIIEMCNICIKAGADYIKTSTGFDTSGALVRDVELMKKVIGDRPLKIKAAGGIRTLEEAEKFIDVGADRIGSSKIIPTVIAENNM